VAINTDILGMVWDYPDTYVVGREKVREFALAVKADDPACLDEEAAAELGHDAIVAPPTFVTILGKLVQADFMRRVDTGYETLQMVQVDQRCCTPGWKSNPSWSGSVPTSSSPETP
jgi:hypothetical protein